MPNINLDWEFVEVCDADFFTGFDGGVAIRQGRRMMPSRRQGVGFKEDDNSLLGEFLVGCLLGSEKNDEG